MMGTMGSVEIGCRGWMAFACAICLWAGSAVSQGGGPPGSIQEEVSFEQKLDAQVPLELPFVDETGREVKLGDYFGQGKPVILTLVYYECPMMCTQVLNGLVASLKDVPFEPGKDFEIVTVSFNPEETPKLAAVKKQTYVKEYGRAGAQEGWHFLTGRLEPIRRLTHSVGFKYALDERSGQYVHAAGIIVLTPQGKTSRYFYDVVYPPQDIRLGLVEASQGKIGGPVEYVLLLCFHYDPLTGTYTPAILGILRLAGVLTVALIGGYVGLMLLRERRKRGTETVEATPGTPAIAGSGNQRKG